MATSNIVKRYGMCRVRIEPQGSNTIAIPNNAGKVDFGFLNGTANYGYGILLIGNNQMVVAVNERVVDGEHEDFCPKLSFSYNNGILIIENEKRWGCDLVLYF